jgi:hypothetical protein
MDLSEFKIFFENQNFAIRYIHKDGKGYMNRNSFNIDRLSDDEYLKIEDEFLSLQQPSRDIWNQPIIFAFTPEGERQHKRLITLLKKAS